MSSGEASTVLKRELRKRMRLALQTISSEQLVDESARLTRHVLSSASYQNAEAIAVYSSMPHEFNTRDIMLDAFAASKRVFLPRVISNGNRTMVMLELRNMDELAGWVPNHWGIREPPDEPQRADSPRDMSLDLILVPGVAFDISGARCGYGMGFYDVFLTRYKAIRGVMPRLVAPALRTQVVESVPMTQRDWRVDEVIVVP
jgi:5-formyltetrahydrofolate cyclo-ligase